jgi:hypothetical protein
MVPKREPEFRIAAAEVRKTRWEDHQAKIANGGQPVGKPPVKKFRDRM